MFSTVLLNSSRTCNRPHHGIPPDRNLVGIIGVDLPALLLSKSVYPDPSGPQHSAEIFQIAPENKKPGVERRAKPPPKWLCAKLDKF